MAIPAREGGWWHMHTCVVISNFLVVHEGVLSRNGNGTGLSQVFLYPDPTSGPGPAAQTRPVY